MPKIKREKIYSREEIEAALEDVKKGVSLRAASRSHNVPRSTLYSKLTNKTSLETKPGPATYLSPEQEHQIIEWMSYLRDRGFSITKNQLLDSVRDVIVTLGRKTPFKDSRPGRHWFEAFLRRHPEAAGKIIKHANSSKVVGKKSLRHWFLEVKQLLETRHLLEASADRVYNLKLTDFQLKASSAKKKDDDKEWVRVLFAANAAGDVLPPLVGFSYQRIPGNVSKSLPKDWKVSGGSTEVFREYISTSFYPWLILNKIKFPVALYIDGAANLSMSVVNYCRKVQIELIALCPDATRLLQPVEIAVLKPLVKSWREVDKVTPVKKDNFAPVLNEELLKIEKMSEEVKSAFRTCGLCPFSVEVVNYGLNDKEENSETDVLDTNPVRINLSDGSEEYLRFLEFFEEHLEEDVLKSFKETSEDFEGEEKNRGLFEFWVNIKKKCVK